MAARATWILAAVTIAVVFTSCGDGSTMGTEPAEPIAVAAYGSRVGCPYGPYFPLSALDSAPPLISDSPVPDVAHAIAGFLESETGAFWPQQGWRVLDVVDAERVLLVHPGSAGHREVAFMSVEWSDEGWRWGGSSIPNDCALVVEPESSAGAVVDWVLNPDAELISPDTTVLTLLATEQGCASGQPMGDRLNEPDIVMTAEAVLISLTAQPRQGDQTCPGNPSQRVVIELPEPVGERTVRDARSTDLGELRDLLHDLID